MSTLVDVQKPSCNLFPDLRSWTDDLPVCKDSGICSNKNLFKYEELSLPDLIFVSPSTSI